MLLLFLLLIWLISLVSLLPAWHFLIEIVINCSHYLLAINLIVLILIAFARMRVLHKICSSLVTLILIYLHASVLHDFVFAEPKFKKIDYQNSAKFKIFYANVETAFGSHEKLSKLISSSDPDLVALLEVDQTWLSHLQLGKLYSFNIIKPADDNFELALYSKLPIKEKLNGDFGVDLKTHLVVDLDLGKNLSAEFILVHAIPPISNAALRHNRLLFRRIATHARNSRNNMLLVGDFNATPYSENLQKLLKWAKMKHVAVGQGLYSSWHARYPGVNFMIDHILIKGCLHAQSFKTLDGFNSDHYPLVAELEICQR